jgi:hypothetical protein
LRLQLDPQHLGGVTVTMRLAGTRLELRVEAEQPETARLIGKDKSLIVAKLQSAGYELDTLVIQQLNTHVSPPKLGVQAMPNVHARENDQASGGPSNHDRSPNHGRDRFRPAPAGNEQDGPGIGGPGGELFI